MKVTKTKVEERDRKMSNVSTELLLCYHLWLTVKRERSSPSVSPPSMSILNINWIMGIFVLHCREGVRAWGNVCARRFIELSRTHSVLTLKSLKRFFFRIFESNLLLGLKSDESSVTLNLKKLWRTQKKSRWKSSSYVCKCFHPFFFQLPTAVFTNLQITTKEFSLFNLFIFFGKSCKISVLFAVISQYPDRKRRTKYKKCNNDNNELFLNVTFLRPRVELTKYLRAREKAIGFWHRSGHVSN